jgi:UDP-N-acetylmuramyl tripeptide synthase
MTAGAEDAPQAFDDSRRLLGPNRWFGQPAVVLTALGEAAQDTAALAAWAARVRALCAALQWPDPQPQAQPRRAGATLAFVAPPSLLFTATEVNEWAWERSAADAGAAASTAAPAPAPTQPATDDLAVLAPLFAARAAAERSAPLQRLQAAAAAHGLPLFDDDDSVSIGAGSGSRTWPRAALPLPMDVPWPQLHGAPTLLVTGSNGKTSTTRLLAAMALAAGRSPGHSSTEGVWVAGAQALEGDYAGPAGARAVLRHPGVDVAVLETARGGILRRGLAVQQADVAVVTNVSADHLGEYGVDSVEDIAETKLAVAHAVSTAGTLALNGGDAVLMDVASRTPAVQAVRARQGLALFAHDADHPALQALRAAGGNTCGVRGGHLWARLGGQDHDLGAIETMPLTLRGAAAFHVENIAAAVLAAHAAGLPLAAISTTLQTFGSHPQDNAGRLERWLWQGATVLIDYAHNPDGLAQLLQVARALQPARLGLLLGQAGNRDDDAIAHLARTAAAAAPDKVVVKELPGMLRGRPAGQVPALLDAALRQAGLPAEHIAHEPDEATAALALLHWARPRDVLVLAVHTAAVRAQLATVLGAAPAA